MYRVSIRASSISCFSIIYFETSVLEQLFVSGGHSYSLSNIFEVSKSSKKKSCSIFKKYQDGQFVELVFLKIIVTIVILISVQYFYVAGGFGFKC